MYDDEKTQLEKTIAEYERLRKFLRALDEKASQVDGQLVEMEKELPEDYVGDGKGDGAD